jgi:peptidoglycan/LPS O-acetylase OafA/YrhL
MKPKKLFSRTKPALPISNHLREIDGLRALAVLAIVIYHFENKYLPYGYLGVDIFFAISGYVITKSILERMEAGLFTINDFFMRRAKRLLPALAAMVTVSIVVATLLLPGRSPLATGAAAFVGTSNIMLWFRDLDYFNSSTAWNPLTHTWSLGVEEQFYLLFPFMLLLVRGKRWATFLLLGVAALTSLTTYIGLWTDHRMSVFYLTPFRLWELIAGALVCIAYRTWGCSLEPAHQSLLKWGFLCTLLAVLFSDGLPEHFATLLCVLGSSGVLYLSGGDSKPNQILRNRLSVFIGKISYSVYLWHWPVVVFSKLILPPASVLPDYVVLTTGLSLLSYYGIEQTFLYRKWNLFRERFIIAFPSYVVAAAVVVVSLWIAKPMLYLGPKQMLEVEFLKNDACHIPDENGLISCLRENTGGDNTIWLIGDSHAGNLLVSLRSAAESLGVSFQHLTSRSLFLSLANQCTLSFCPEGSFTNLATRLKAVSKPGDIVVISFTRDRFQSETGANDIFSQNLENFVGELNATEVNVVLVEDIPKVCNDDKEYMQSAFRPEVCSISAAQSRRARSVLSTIYRNIDGLQPVTILDSHDRLCEQVGNDDLRCSNWLGSELLYLDASPHLTFRASASLARFFVDKLTRKIDRHEFRWQTRIAR